MIHPQCSDFFFIAIAHLTLTSCVVISKEVVKSVLRYACLPSFSAVLLASMFFGVVFLPLPRCAFTRLLRFCVIAFPLLRGFAFLTAWAWPRDISCAYTEGRNWQVAFALGADFRFWYISAPAVSTYRSSGVFFIATLWAGIIVRWHTDTVARNRASVLSVRRRALCCYEFARKLNLPEDY